MRTSLRLIALPIALLVACGDDDGSGNGGSESEKNDSTSGASPNGGGASSAGGSTRATDAGGSRADGSTSSRGDASAGRGGATSGMGGSGGSSATAGGSTGGQSSGDGAAGDRDGGTPTATGGSDGGGATGCTRELLQATIGSYFDALAAHDPSMLPLADGVKFTENGETLELGEAGLWKSAGALKYVHSALDTETCQSASQAVVPDGTTDIPVALRLKLEAEKLTEIETIAVRSGDYTVLGSAFASDTRALAASAMSVKWEEPVATAQRNSRDEITGWIDKYFRMFPRGVCDTASTCKRIENGGGNFDCSFGASCAATQPGPSDNALKPRLLLADVETGIGVGFTIFMGNTDMHMYKMYGGQIYEVSAILGQAASSGWD